MSSRLTHIGLCVGDIEASVAFYVNALGFEVFRRMHVDGPETGRLLDVPGAELNLVYLRRDGMSIELIGYVEPSTIGDGGPRPMNQVGLTHLSFLVDDVDAVRGRIIEHGGRQFPSNTVTFDGGNRGLMFCDPDGTRLEIIERVSAKPRKEAARVRD